MKRLIPLIALMMGAASCTSGLKKPIHEVTATAGPDSIQHVTITAHSFWFDPNRIVVKRGMPVELKVKNGAMFVPHDFYCGAKDAGIEVNAPVGMFHGSKVVHFTPTHAGEFGFACGVDGHAKKGMRGTLVVKD